MPTPVNVPSVLLDVDVLRHLIDYAGSTGSLAKASSVMFVQNRVWTAPRIPVSQNRF